ncbi:unnamed protein product [Coregonus sp. 'balchen']|nr:unnamed protein product [Coregonus sp. 'balchen']
MVRRHKETINNCGTLANVSLPPGVTYPVQIPAGVTLQTASGQLYKVNVPVMLSQAPAGHCPLPSAPALAGGTCSGAERSQLSFPAVSHGGLFYCPEDHDPSEDRTVLPTACGPSQSFQENHLLQQPQVPSAQARFSVQTPVSFQFLSQPPSHPPSEPLPTVVKMEMTCLKGQSLGVGSDFGASEVGGGGDGEQEDHGGAVADMTTHLGGLPVDAT